MKTSQILLLSSLLCLTACNEDNQENSDKITLEYVKAPESEIQISQPNLITLDNNPTYTNSDFHIEAVNHGLFVFKLNNQTVYGRAAHLRLDNEGYARTVEGAYIRFWRPTPGDDSVFLVGEMQDLNLAQYTRWNINTQGVISAEDSEGNISTVGKLAALHTYDNYFAEITAIGNGLFTLTQNKPGLTEDADIAFSTEVSQPQLNCAHYPRTTQFISFSIESNGTGYFALSTSDGVIYAKSLSLGFYKRQHDNLFYPPPTEDRFYMATNSSITEKLAGFEGQKDEASESITGQFEAITIPVNSGYFNMFGNDCNLLHYYFYSERRSYLYSLAHIRLFSFEHPEKLTEISPGRWKPNSETGDAMVVSGCAAPYGPITFIPGPWPLDDQCPGTP